MLKDDLLPVSYFKKMEEISKLSRTKKDFEKINDILKDVLDYEYEISELDIDFLCSSNIAELLGQVKTPSWAADIISHLCIKDPKHHVLDPCFGEGVFLKSSFNRIKELDRKSNPQVWGIEIDPKTFAKGLSQVLAYSKSEIENKSLFCGSIFDFDKKTFDCIVLNPPYTRHEEISNLKNKNMKNDIRKKIKKIYDISLSSRSNLYIYFLIYLSSLLKPNGFMGAIIPKGWLDSKHGSEFQKFLLNYFNVEAIIDFEKDTFNDVIVEDCIIILRKNPNVSTKTRFIHLRGIPDMKKLEKLMKLTKSSDSKTALVSVVEKNMLLNDHKWGKYLQLQPRVLEILKGKNLVKLSQLADVRRGYGTNWNEFFILDSDKSERLGIEKEFLKKIISSPRKITRLDTNDGVVLDNLIFLEHELEYPTKAKNLKQYVEQSAMKLEQLKDQQILKYMLKKNPNSWYLIKPHSTAPIIFSYIIRKMKFFILNSKEYLVRDNFYNIFPKDVEEKILFAVLNSSFSRLQLELIGRRYGNGMLKIQAYELLDMLVPDLRKISKKTHKELSDAAQDLSACFLEDEKIPEICKQIDSSINKFCGLQYSTKEISKIEQNLMTKRLMR